MNFAEILDVKAACCGIILSKCMDSFENNDTDLYEAMKYSLNNGGKRLRMIILQEAMRLFSNKTEDAFPFSCAVEMIHAYSLIHDDLPSMDNAEYRRGKPCCHVVYGESTAILAGDGLFHYAVEIMLEAVLEAGGSMSHLKAFKEIVTEAGVSGMILGQAMDTDYKKEKDIELLKTIYRKKTASMFIGPMKAGAYLGEASESLIKDISSYAYNFGMAFQITDDILDETGELETVGKNVKSDSKNGKDTIVSRLGIDKSRKMAEKYAYEAKKYIKDIDKDKFFTSLCDYVTCRLK